MKKAIALIFAASTLLLASCCTTHHVENWEYKETSDFKEVNALGKAGWSLIDVFRGPNGGQIYTLKHEVQ